MTTADRYFALGVESTYGTSVTPTIFLPVTTADVVEPPPPMINFGGIRYGEYGMNEDDLAFGPRANGTVNFEGALTQTSWHTILSHVFGSITTTSTTPTRVSTLTIGSSNGLYMTTQILKPYQDGSGSLVQTAKGCKFTQASISVQKGGVMRFSGQMDARNVVSSVSATTASYTTSRPLLWHKTSTLTIDGNAVSVSGGWTLEVTRPLDTNTNVLDTTGFKSEPTQNGPTGLRLTVSDVVWNSTAHYDNVMSTTSGGRIKAIVIKTTSDTNTAQYLELNMTKAMYVSGPPAGLQDGQFRIPTNLVFDIVYPSGGSVSPITASFVHV